MPVLLAEVMDKVAEGFTAALASASVAAAVGLALGRWAPRPVAGLALAVAAVVAWLMVVGDLADPDDWIRARARAEAGGWGVVQDVASIHLAWLGPLAGTIVGLCLRGRPDEEAVGPIG